MKEDVDGRVKPGHDVKRFFILELPVDAVPMQRVDDAAFGPVALLARPVVPPIIVIRPA
jgi:hypothetical protein